MLPRALRMSFSSLSGVAGTGGVGASSLIASATLDYARLRGDPVATLAAARAADPGSLVAAAAQGFLLLLSTGVNAGGPTPAVRSCTSSSAAASAHATVADSLADVSRLLASGRGDAAERGYARAFALWASGRRRAAAAALEGALIASPTSLLALRTAHDVAFFNGDARALRDGAARALAAWDARAPGYASVCGMLAFGLQEGGAYEAAEALGMRALALDPLDAWAVHAVAHCYEMTARRDEGKRFLADTAANWEVAPPAPGAPPGAPPRGATLLEHHLQWHWALLELGAGAPEHALARYDNRMAVRTHSAVTPVLNLTDSASLLWRLELARAPLLAGGAGGAADPSQPLSRAYLAHVDGLDGDSPRWLPCGARAPTRWTELARHIQADVAQHIAAVNDAQITMALCAAGDGEGLERHLTSMAEYAASLAPASSGAKDAAAAAAATADFGAGNDAQPVWSSQLPGLPLLAAARQASAAVPLSRLAPSRGFAIGEVDDDDDDELDGGIADNVFVTAVVGLDLSRGLAMFWRATEPERLAHARVVVGSGGSADEVTASEGWGSMLSRMLSGSVSERAAPADSTADSSNADPSLDADAAATTAAAFVAATASLRYLLRSRAHWWLLGCSQAQRDVFEQTIIHAAVAAGRLPLAAALAGERATLRFADPQAWGLLAAVLERLGEPARAADARNKAYALGLGSRGSL